MTDRPKMTDPRRDKFGRFTKGNSGNPRGTPKTGHAIKEIFNDLLSGDLTKEDIEVAIARNPKDMGAWNKKLFYANILAGAIAGNDKDKKIVLEYTEGRPVEYIVSENINHNLYADFTKSLGKHFGITDEEFEEEDEDNE